MSTLKVNTLQNTSGVEVYTAKAWVNFNGTGTVAIRASGNVSSITDNGTGDYTVNFTTAMPDTNYAPIIGNVWDSQGFSGTGYFNNNAIYKNGSITTTSFGILTGYSFSNTSAKVDVDMIFASVFR